MRQLFSLFAVLVVVSACTRPVSMKAGWEPDARPPTAFSKVLVVVVSENFERRRLFENALVDELVAGGGTATPSTRTLLTTDVLDRDVVAKLVKATGSQAVLVTRLVNQAVDVTEKGGREVVKVDSPDDSMRDMDRYAYNVQRYDFSVSAEPPSLVLERSATVKTELFETGAGKLLYTMQSDVRFTTADTQDQNTEVAVIDKLASALARRLRQDGAVL